jgi:hypothetical protein
MRVPSPPPTSTRVWNWPEEERGRPHGVGRVAAERCAELGEPEAPGLGLLEDAEVGQGPQQPVQRRGVGSGGLGQLLAALGSVGYQVGDAKAGSHVQHLGGEEPEHHLEQHGREPVIGRVAHAVSVRTLRSSPATTVKGAAWN